MISRLTCRMIVELLERIYDFMVEDMGTNLFHVLMVNLLTKNQWWCLKDTI